MTYLILVSLIWSFSFGLIGNTLEGVPAAWQGMIRLGIAAIVFLPFVRKVDFRLGVKLFLIGMVQFGLMYLFYITAFKHLKSYEVALFTALTPVYVVMLNDIFFKKSFSPTCWAAAALAVVGGGVILWKQPISAEALKGFCLVQASNVCFAIGQLVYRAVLKNATSLTNANVFFWLYLGAVTILIPFAVGGEALGTVRPDQWWALVYLGAIASGLSFFLWNAGARTTTAGTLAVMNNLKIPLATVVSLTVFGEEIRGVTFFLGALLFLLALVPQHLKRM